MYDKGEHGDILIWCAETDSSGGSLNQGLRCLGGPMGWFGNFEQMYNIYYFSCFCLINWMSAKVLIPSVSIQYFISLSGQLRGVSWCLLYIFKCYWQEQIYLIIQYLTFISFLKRYFKTYLFSRAFSCL